jgi:hypothetical protein
MREAAVHRWISKCLLPPLVVCAAALSPRLAAAGWTEFVSLGDVPILSDLSCASAATGSAVCAGSGPGHVVEFIAYDKGAWGAWAPRGTVSTSAPSCAATGSGTVLCAATGPAVGSLVLDIFGGAELAVDTRALMPTDPTCVAPQPDRVFCVAPTLTSRIGSVRHGIVGVTFDVPSGKAEATTRLTSEKVYSQIGCAPDGLGHAVCAWVSADGHIAARQYLGQPFPPSGPLPWTAEVDLMGLPATAPQCFYSGVAGVVACAGVSSDTNLYGNAYNGRSFDADSWTGWQGIAGPVTGFGCAGLGAIGGHPSFMCGIVSARDNHFYTGVDTGQGWGGFILHHGYYVGNSVEKVYEPGYFIGNPTCFPIDQSVMPARLMCVVRAQDHTVYSTIGP